MKILVSIKRVIDYNVKIRLKPDGSGVDTTQVNMSINPFDAIALEEAVRLKEAGIATEIIALSIGDSTCQETLRLALALGASRAIWIEAPATLQPLTIAKLLAELAKQELPDLILSGKQAIDDDCNQTPQMLAGLLSWPQAMFASKITINKNNREAIVEREVDNGLETLRVTLPAVISTDLRLNEPRYASLPNIMQARQKVIEKKEAALLGVPLKTTIETITVTAPPKRKAGSIVSSVAELVEKLKDAGVIT